MKVSHCTKLRERLALARVLPVYYWILPSKKIAAWNPPMTPNINEDLEKMNTKAVPRPGASENSVNILRLLSFMAIEFIVTNIPMAVLKICLACGVDSSQPGFKQFQTLSIVLEIFFAASDFYIFCFCHKTFRKKVSFLFKSQDLIFS